MNSQRGRRILGAVLVLVALTAVYAAKLENGFVYDDRVFIVDAHDQADPANIPAFFAGHQHRLYRPLRSTIYTLVRQIRGLDPVVHNVAGIVFHALAVLVFYTLVLALSKSVRAATFAGAIVALHPLASAHVAFITSSFDLPGLVLAFGALAVYLGWLNRGGRWRLMLTWLLLLAGLTGSEEAATVPLFMVLFYGLDPQRSAKRGRFVVATAGAVALVAVYIAFRAHAIPGFSRVDEYVAGGAWETVLTMSVVFWRYVRFAFFPVGMAAEHAVPIYTGLFPVPLIAMAGMLALAGAAFALRRRLPWFGLSVGWFFIALAPFSNLIPLQSLFAERYGYSALMGFALGLGWGVDRWLGRLRGRTAHHVAAAGFAGLLVAYALLTALRIPVWHDDYALWTDAIAKQPNTYNANVNFAGGLIERNDPKRAMVHLNRAVALDPKQAVAYTSIGNILREQGRHAQARESYVAARQRDPQSLNALVGLAQTELALGMIKLALLHGADVINKDPDNVIGLNVFSAALIGSGRCAQAIPVLRRLIDAAGDDSPFGGIARVNLASCNKLLSAGP